MPSPAAAAAAAAAGGEGPAGSFLEGLEDLENEDQTAAAGEEPAAGLDDEEVSSPSTSSAEIAAAAAAVAAAENPSSNGGHRLSAASDPVPSSADKPAAAEEDGSAAPDGKRRRTEGGSEPGKGPPAAAAAAEDSRRLFQRLWTDDDEIAILQGFLAFTSQRSSSLHHNHQDTGAFYDQIRARIQLDFNKNQLVEKLRRLKKKYRNITNRIRSGKDYAFKSPHDQAAFDLSDKIWGSATAAAAPDDDDDDDDDGGDRWKRHRKRPATAAATAAAPAEVKATGGPMPVPNVIEETMRSCLSPMFKELLHCATPPAAVAGGWGGLGLSPLPFGLGGPAANAKAPTAVVDAKWRKQQILELEVFSRRIDLMQEQIKLVLAELRSAR